MVDLREKWSRWWPRRNASGMHGTGLRRPSLVKSAPESVAASYQIVRDDHVVDTLFQKMRNRLFEAADRAIEGAPWTAAGISSPVTFREHGRIAPDRRYFFMKPQNEAGWLFERSGAGWVVSRADKIGNETFLRQGEPWDIVSLFMVPGRTLDPRISSQQMGTDLVSLSFYSAQLMDQLHPQHLRGNLD